MNALFEIFSVVLNLSLMGSVVILAVCLFRLPLKKAPKRFSYWLWAAAGFRLVCPVSVSGIFSLFAMSSVSTLDVAGPLTYSTYGPAVYQQLMETLHAMPSDAAETVSSGFPWQAVLHGAAVLWALGVIVMLTLAAVSYIRANKRLGQATRLYGNLYECEVRSPFVAGVFKPRIYIPYGLSREERECVICHESCHIRRRDHLTKPLAYFILSLHWFNPIVWLGFFLMTRDMEMSCDEHALQRLGTDAREDYSRALVSLAENRRAPVINPLAFGETDIKERVKNAMNFHRAKKWTSVAAGAACVLIMTACAANPGNSVSSMAIIGGADGPTQIFVTGGESASASSSPEDLAYEGKHIAITRQELEDYLENVPHVSEKDAADVLAWPRILARRAYDEGIDFSFEEYGQKADEYRQEVEKADNYEETMELLLAGKNMTEEEYWERLPGTAEFQREILAQEFLTRLKERFDAENAGKMVDWNVYLEEYKKNAIQDEQLRKVGSSPAADGPEERGPSSQEELKAQREELESHLEEIKKQEEELQRLEEEEGQDPSSND